MGFLRPRLEIFEMIPLNTTLSRLLGFTTLISLIGIITTVGAVSLMLPPERASVEPYRKRNQAYRSDRCPGRLRCLRPAGASRLTNRVWESDNSRAALDSRHPFSPRS